MRAIVMLMKEQSTPAFMAIIFCLPSVNGADGQQSPLY